MKKFKYYVIIFFILITALVKGQTDSADRNNNINDDTIAGLFYSQNELFRHLADSLGKAEITKNLEKQIYSRQMSLLANLSKTMYKVDDYYKKEIDTAYINKNLSEIENEFLITSKGIISDSVEFVTERNLSTSALLLKGLQIRLDYWKKKLIDYTDQLEEFRRTIDSLQTDTLLFKFARDSVLFIQYFNNLVEVSNTLTPIDENLTALIKVMHDNLSRINDIGLMITSAKQKIVEKSNLNHKIFSTGIHPISGHPEAKKIS